MATSYPSGLDNFTNPTSSNNLNDAGVLHADEHTNVNDAIKAIETELGTLPKGAAASVRARLDALDAALAGKATALDGGPMLVQKNTAPAGTTEFWCAMQPVGCVTSNSYGLGVASTLYGHIVGVPRSLTLVKQQLEVNTAGAAGATMRLGIYNVNSDGWPTTLVWDSGSFLVDTTGNKAFTSSISLPAGSYFVAGTTSDTTVRFRGWQYPDRQGSQNGFGTNLTNRGYSFGSAPTGSALPSDLSSTAPNSANGSTQGVPNILVSISAVT